MSKPAFTGRYTRSKYPPPPFSEAEVDTIHTMHTAGCSLKSIAAFLGRSKSGVARYIPRPDSPDPWDAPPALVEPLSPPPEPVADLYARWQARMPALREAVRKAGAAP